MVAQNHRHLPFLEGMLQQQALQRAALEARQLVRIARRHAIALQACRCQPLGQHHPLAFAGARKFQQQVGEIRAQRHGLVGRQGPRRGGPDDHRAVGHVIGRCGYAAREVGAVHDAKRHINGRRMMRLVFDLGLRQRRAAIQAPVHRLGAQIDMAVGDDLAQRADLLGLVLRIHRHVGPVPVAEHAESLEIPPLQVELLLRIVATGGAKSPCVQLLADTPVLLLHLHLDRQAMAVPARHVGGVVAIQRARLDHQILQDLVHGMAQVNRAIGIRRAVMQGKARPALRDLAQLAVDVVVLPPLEHLRFASCQIGFHREIRAWEVHRTLVIRHPCSPLLS